MSFHFNINLEGIKNFFYEYFISPIYGDTGYNVYNTLIYAVSFLVIFYLLYLFIEKEKVKLTFKTCVASLSLLFLAVELRILEDMGMLNSLFFSSPIIWILFMVFGIFVVHFGKKFERKLQLYKTLFYIPLVFSLPIFILLVIPNIVNLKILFAIPIFLLSSIPFVLIRKKVYFLKDKLGFLALLFHLFDCSVTFTTLTLFPNMYFEQHVYASFLINKFGIFAIFPGIISIVLLYLYYCSKIEEKNLKNFLLLVALWSGFTPSVRDFIRVLLMT